MEMLTHWITDYGYIGIFCALVLGIAGLPIPDETLLTFAGYLVFKEQLGLPLTLLSAFLGSTCGISLSYGLGRSVGLFLIHKYGYRVGITEKKMQRTLEWFDRIGKWSLTVGYFIPGIRHLTAYVAGASKLQYPIFALYAYSGGIIWCSTFIFLGYFLGEGWEKFPAQLDQKIMYGVGGIILVGIVAFVIKRRMKMKRDN